MVSDFRCARRKVPQPIQGYLVRTMHLALRVRPFGNTNRRNHFYYCQQHSRRRLSLDMESPLPACLRTCNLLFPRRVFLWSCFANWMFRRLYFPKISTSFPLHVRKIDLRFRITAAACPLTEFSEVSFGDTLGQVKPRLEPVGFFWKNTPVGGRAGTNFWTRRYKAWT